MVTIIDSTKFLTLECEYSRGFGVEPHYTITFASGDGGLDVVAEFDDDSIEPALAYVRAVDPLARMFRVSNTTAVYILTEWADFAKLQADALAYNRPETAPEATLDD